MALTRRTLLTGLLATTAGALLVTPVPALADDTIRLSGRAFGTSWQLLLRGSGDVEGLARAAADVLERIDGSMSPYRADSAISRFNAGAKGSHAVDADFALVTAEALRIAALSDGAFDPSVGPDVGLYGFGPIQGERVGTYAGFRVAGQSIEKTDPRLTLDLCGIAKGHALDLLAAATQSFGYEHFLAEIGGEVLARGTEAGGHPWRIGISDPLGRGLYGVIDTRGLALATSGDAINAYDVAGRRYSHIIDPRTDAPLFGRTASVSVLAPTAMTADALSTALMVMGPEAGSAFAATHGLAVLFLLRRGDGLEAVASPAFDHYLLS
jgi:thiamine biosynthesis lipoprotein